MRRAIAIMCLAAGLAGCDAISILMDGLKYKSAVEDDLEQATGVKPQVGFNWRNGSLQLVTVTFQGVYDSKPLNELAEEVRAGARTYCAGLFSGRNGFGPDRATGKHALNRAPAGL